MIARLLCAAALAGMSAGPAAADSFRCDGGIVQTGDTKLDLLAKCGEPVYVEPGPRIEEHASRWDAPPDAAFEERVRWSVERWSYDLGPGAFMQHVELAGGRVVAVLRGERGTESAPRGAWLVRARCEPAAIHRGDRAAEVLARCGEPVVRDAGRRTRVSLVQRTADTVERTTISVPVEQWVFDFGPQRFTSIVLLEDGVVCAVERGGYGYAPAP
jgi:hypothetical protein